MTSLKRRLISGCVAVTTAALSIAGLAVATAAPATAVSGTLSYTCTGSPDLFSAVVDTDAPATLGSGLSVPITTTSTVTVPAVVADVLRGQSITTVDGTATATVTVDGVGRQAALTIPKTPVPPTSGTTMQVVGSGPAGSIAAGAPGATILIGTGSFTATVSGYNSAGTPVATYYFTCTPQPGQNLLVDTVAVVPTPTTTTLTVQNAPLGYGGSPIVLAEVAVTGSSAKPAGKVAFIFAGKTVTVDVKGGKAKATMSPALTLGTNQVTATFTPTDKNLATSQATKAFSVVKAETVTSTTATYRPLRHRLVAKSKVTSAYGTPVDGEVKYVLKRDGVRIRSAIVELNKFDVARKVFKNIRKKGTYVVRAKYLGSDTLKRSRDRVKLVI